MTDPQKNISAAYGAVLFVAVTSLLAGILAVLFEIRLLQRLGHGWTSIFFGVLFTVLGVYTKRGSLLALSIAAGVYTIDIILFIVTIAGENPSLAGGLFVRGFILWLMARGILSIRELENLPAQQSIESPPAAKATPAPPVSLAPPPVPTRGATPISFVAPAPSTVPSQPQTEKRSTISKSITPEILNIRFVAYRCELASDHVKAIYQNASQRELKWFEVSAIVIRQLPFQAPWDGKLLLDIVPVAVAGDKAHPIRLLSGTYVNYGFLPGGQSASTRENIRRMAAFMLNQNRSIFIDPGTDAFIHAGQPPVRFLSMSQFNEYDSHY